MEQENEEIVEKKVDTTNTQDSTRIDSVKKFYKNFQLPILGSGLFLIILISTLIFFYIGSITTKKRINIKNNEQNIHITPITRNESVITSVITPTAKPTATLTPSPTKSPTKVVIKTPTATPSPTSSPTNTPSPTTPPSPKQNSFYGTYLDENLNPTSISGLKVTVNSDGGFSSSSTNSPKWEFTDLQPGNYTFTIDLPSGYTMQSMACYNCTSYSAYSYGGSSNQLIINLSSGNYYGVNVKLIRQ